MAFVMEKVAIADKNIATIEGKIPFLKVSTVKSAGTNITKNCILGTKIATEKRKMEKSEKVTVSLTISLRFLP